MEHNQSNTDSNKNEESSNDNWWEQPLPVEENEEETHEAKPFNPNDVTEEEVTGIQKFMNISLVPHIQVADEIKHQIKEGNIDPIQTFIALKKVEKIFKLCLDSQDGDKELREIMLNKVRSFLDGGKSVDIYGANLRIQATGTNYDFSECGDSILNELMKIQDIIKDCIKRRQEIIKTTCPSDSTKLGIQSAKIIQSGFPSLTFDDNEFEETIFPAIKRSGESVICTFKKEK